jgi:hypothetical protein
MQSLLPWLVWFTHRVSSSSLTVQQCLRLTCYVGTVDLVHRSVVKSMYSLCIINHMNHNCSLPLTMSLHLNSDLQPYTWTDGLSFNCKTNTGASFLVCTDWKTTRTDHDHDEIMTGSFQLCRTSCSSLALPETMIVRVSKLARVGSWDFGSVHLLL